MAAVERIRRADPEWEIGDAVAAGFDAIAEHLVSLEDDLAQRHPSDDRMAEIERRLNDLVGPDLRDGRIGRIEARIPASSEERASEKAVVASIRWGTAKIMVALFALASLVGGSAWSLREGYERSIAAKASAETSAEIWRAVFDRDLDRLYALFNLKRTPEPEPPP